MYIIQFVINTTICVLFCKISMKLSILRRYEAIYISHYDWKYKK